ncbi:MAG: tRNA (guanosine(37)-N1)-methyltransferase TrmD [Chloroflexi bacterium]|nr:tRNA (guanosine(37)-N1)-methyltransferase TrmD [Chloroflexota bacterium]MBU1750323.1 tRNA (guanosine(37)-N1)-methyltransferase TrmD [Chloroflexota bacterium]MBU1878877.1 tRNA (guanosine(37)-N1)-methyltransferase TrmD [Chloroflexota bacterium]
MQFDILTLFPNLIRPLLAESILARAIDRGLIQVQVHDIREHAEGRHLVADDYPYGGGGGMVMKPEPIFRSVEALLTDSEPRPPIILLTPQGRVLTQAVVRELAGHRRLVLVCGHYEGVDERVRQHLVTHEISIGDYVLTGGELPALIIVDAVSRLVPGVLGDEAAPDKDSHSAGLLEYPHYTRPPEFRGWPVPDVLLSGHHAKIERWRRQQALCRTWARRPDLLRHAPLTDEDRRFLGQWIAGLPEDDT